MLINREQPIVDVFSVFCQDAAHPFPYPEDNLTIFEEWYFDHFTPDDARERRYLPIFWTGYYIRAKYGKDPDAIAQLQGYLNMLDTSKKYYTIVQYDDGILNDLSGLDIRVFSMSGKPMDYPLPLICMPHNFHFKSERDIFMSFVGRATHPIRENILAEYGGQEGEIYITDRHHSLHDYCKILSRSKFALCPRGYGPTSFRIVEALQYGAVPVYLSDQIIDPHNRDIPGLSMDTTYATGRWAQNLPTYIKGFCQVMRYEKMKTEIPKYYENFCTYEANRRLILENLLHEDPGQLRCAAN